MIFRVRRVLTDENGTLDEKLTEATPRSLRGSALPATGRHVMPSQACAVFRAAHAHAQALRAWPPLIGEVRACIEEVDMGAYSEPRHDGGGIASRSHREQQRTAICVATAVCSTRAGGFGSHKAIDPLECGQRRCVLPNVALRTLQVLVMLVKNGGRMLADDELQDKPTAVHRPATSAQPAPASHSGWGSTSTEFSRRGDFGQRVRVDPVEMWPARERAAQRRAAHRAGVDVVGASATLWGRGVQARILGDWRKTDS